MDAIVAPKASRRLIQPVTPSSSTRIHNSQTIQTPSGLCPAERGACPRTRRRRYALDCETEGRRPARPAWDRETAAQLSRTSTTAEAA